MNLADGNDCFLHLRQNLVKKNNVELLRIRFSSILSHSAKTLPPRRLLPLEIQYTFGQISWRLENKILTPSLRSTDRKQSRGNTYQIDNRHLSATRTHFRKMIPSSL